MWPEIQITPGKIVFAILGTIAMVGIMIYLRLSFQEADVKTAISLVEMAKASGISLQERIEKFLPTAQKYCEAKALNNFYGHMEVRCKDLADTTHILVWNVNLSDGMVKPANEAAEKLGKGSNPWEK